MSDSNFRLLGNAPLQLPAYTYSLLCNSAREIGVSPTALTANLLSSIAAKPSLMQDVLDSSTWYVSKLEGDTDE